MIQNKLLISSILLLTSTELAAHPLSEAIQKALNSNPQMQSARAGITIAEAQLKQMQGAYYPTIDLALQSGKEHTNKPGAPPEGGDPTMFKQDHSLTLTQKLFDGGMTDSVVERSEKMLNNARIHQRDIEGTISINVIESWYELYRLQQVIKLTEENVAKHKLVFEQIQQKAEAGAAAQAELALAEGPYILSLTALVANKGLYRDATARYATVVGELPVLPLPSPDLEIEVTLPENVDQAITHVQANAATIQTAISNLQAAEADRKGAQSSLFPTFDFELKNLFKNDAGAVEGKEYGWTALLKMNYNLFRGGTDKARREETATAVVDAKEQLDLARRGAEEQTKILWGAVEVSNDILELNHQQQLMAIATRDTTNEQFKMGEVDIMAIMGAEDALFAAKQAVLQEEVTGALSRFRLLNQLGYLTATPCNSADCDAATDNKPNSDEVHEAEDREQQMMEQITDKMGHQVDQLLDTPLSDSTTETETTFSSDAPAVAPTAADSPSVTEQESTKVIPVSEPEPEPEKLTTTDADSQTNLETNLNSTVDGETEIAAEAAVETPEEAVVQTITELTGPADQTKVTVARNEENYIEVERASEETRSPTNHQVEITGPQNAEKTTVDHSNTIYREREIPKASITVDQPAEETESSVAPAAAEQNSETVNQAATMTPADTASIENTITIEVSSPDQPSTNRFVRGKIGG